MSLHCSFRNVDLCSRCVEHLKYRKHKHKRSCFFPPEQSAGGELRGNVCHHSDHQTSVWINTDFYKLSLLLLLWDRILTAAAPQCEEESRRPHRGPRPGDLPHVPAASPAVCWGPVLKSCWETVRYLTTNLFVCVCVRTICNIFTELTLGRIVLMNNSKVTNFSGGKSLRNINKHSKWKQFTPLSRLETNPDMSVKELKTTLIRCGSKSVTTTERFGKTFIVKLETV